MDWRICDHEWLDKFKDKAYFPATSYRYLCSKCGMYSYVGPMYDLLPDKSKSVFLHGFKPF